MAAAQGAGILDAAFDTTVSEWLTGIVDLPDGTPGSRAKAVKRAKLAWRVGWALAKHASLEATAKTQSKQAAVSICHGRRASAVEAVNSRWRVQQAANGTQVAGGTAMVVGGILMAFPPTTIAGIITTSSGGAAVAGAQAGKAIGNHYKSKAINIALVSMLADHDNWLVKALHLLARATSDAEDEDELHPALESALLKLVDLSISFYRQYPARQHDDQEQCDGDLQDMIDGVIECARKGYLTEMSEVLRQLKLRTAMDVAAVKTQAWVRDLGGLAGVAGFGIISMGCMSAAQYGAAQALQFGQIFQETGVQMAGTFYSNNTQNLANAAGAFAIVAGLLAIGMAIWAIIDETKSANRTIDEIELLHTSIQRTIEICDAPKEVVNLNAFFPVAAAAAGA